MRGAGAAAAVFHFPRQSLHWSALKRERFPVLAVPFLLAAGGCARNVNDYLAEARSGEPGAVKDAVVAIGDLLYRKEAARLAFSPADQEAIGYLKDVAGSSPIPINRAVALGSLARLKKAQAGDIFLASIKDPFWPVRFEAARAMEYQSEERFAAPLHELIARETRPEVRLEAVKALGKIRSPVAVKALLEVFLEPGEAAQDTQLQAYLALKEQTSLSYGFDDRKMWDDYYREHFGTPPAAGAGPAPEGGGTPPGPAAGRAGA